MSTSNDKLWKRIWARVKAAYVVPITVPVRPSTIEQLQRIWLKPVYHGLAATSSGPAGLALIRQVQANFEGREAIYILKGALRVRVSNIRVSEEPRHVSLEVEEIPTPGLGVGSLESSQRAERSTRAWRVVAGRRTIFSDQCWTMGYGGWLLFFDPKAVRGVVDLASQFADKLDTWERYRKIVDLLQGDQQYARGNWQHVLQTPSVNAGG